MHERHDQVWERVVVAAAFAVNGLCFASWLSRTVVVRDALELSPAQLGLVLLCLSGGACVALPAAGPAVHRWGPARVVFAGALLSCVGLVGLAVGVGQRVVWPAAIGLVVTGVGMSGWDVAMNVAGAGAERRLGRSLMPRLHAAFSLGTVAGAGVGALTAAAAVSLPAQVAAIALLAPATMAFAVRRFPATPAASTGLAHATSGSDVVTYSDPVTYSAPRDVWRAWREPRTLLVGLLTLAFAFTEGSANDWLVVAMVDGHGGDQVLGAVGFGVFVTAMTAARLAGGVLLDRFGRVRVLRVAAALALFGLLAVITAPGPGWALGGAALWGLGAALGFPVGMSAAADDPALAAARVGVVSSVAYAAFLAGPPMIGLLAERVGILRALLLVVVALVVALLTAGATRPRSRLAPLSRQPG